MEPLYRRPLVLAAAHTSQQASKMQQSASVGRFQPPHVPPQLDAATRLTLRDQHEREDYLELKARIAKRVAPVGIRHCMEPEIRDDSLRFPPVSSETFYAAPAPIRHYWHSHHWVDHPRRIDLPEFSERRRVMAPADGGWSVVRPQRYHSNDASVLSKSSPWKTWHEEHSPASMAVVTDTSRDHPSIPARDGSNLPRPRRLVPATVSNEESVSIDNEEKRYDPDPPRSKRALGQAETPDEQQAKRTKGLGGLDLLVMASMEMTPLKVPPPTRCSCPKSKCVALYCDCFKAGRRCDPGACTCVDCKNTLNESGPMGARTQAIRSILARNPRAFSSTGSTQVKLAPGQIACNCIRSRCLKLYCTCFQNGQVCKEGVCSCINCLNTSTSRERQLAIESTLQKRPDAFRAKVKEVGLGCACKNNRCIRKYCECFRNGLACTTKCACANCENREGDMPV